MAGACHQAARRADPGGGHDGWIYLHIPATRGVRVVHEIIRPKKTEGAGNAGCPPHPQPRVRNWVEHTSVVTEGTTGITRHSLRNGFNGFLRTLPGDRAFLSPSSTEMTSANLTPASRRQDHTTSPSAKLRALVRSAARVHRISFPTSVTIASRPSFSRTGRRGL